MNLVIFDAFNTIVTAHPDFRRTFSDGLAQAGLSSTPALLAHLQAASEGTAHAEWSVSRDSYVAWATQTLWLVRQSGRHRRRDLAPRIVPALEQLCQAPMVAMLGAEACLAALKAAGFQIAVCSNWGWDLEDDFRGTSLAGYIDTFASSAQVGFRKPNIRIYQAVLTASRTCAKNAVFVGDNIRADVQGPQRAGIRAIHLASAQPIGFSGEHAQSLAAVAELLTDRRLGSALAVQPFSDGLRHRSGNPCKFGAASTQ